MVRFNYKWQAMEFSYCARATPPSPESGQGLAGLLQRLTSKPPPEDPEWRSWLKAYIIRFAPRKPADLFTAPSGHAALGFPRQFGGHAAGVRHLCKIGAAVMILQDHSMSTTAEGSALRSYRTRQAEQWVPDRLYQTDPETAFNTLPEVSRRFQQQLILGTQFVLDNVEHLPVLPISAPEKGLKTRFPTCGLTAANMVLQILRRVADHVLRSDPRISQSLGGWKDVDLRRAGGPWYSQDATAATDLHPQWLTQTLYEELAEYDERLQPYKRYFNLLFGPKKLLLPLDGAIVSPSSLFPDYLVGQSETPNLDIPSVDDMRLMGAVPKNNRIEPAAFAAWFLRRTKAWLVHIQDPLGEIPLSTTGQMMGDPTSFPVLPLCRCTAQRRHSRSFHTPSRRRGRCVTSACGSELGRSQQKLAATTRFFRVGHWRDAVYMIHI